MSRSYYRHLIGANSALPPVHPYDFSNAEAYYKLDGISGSVIDAVNTYNGTAVGSGLTRGVTGKINNGFKTDGLDGYIDWGDNIIFNHTGSFSVSAWVKKETSGIFYVLSKGSDAGGWGISFQIRDADVRLNIITTSTGLVQNNVIVNKSLVLNQFHHLVGVFDSPNQEAKIYINGIVEVTMQLAGSVSRSIGKSYSLADIYGNTHSPIGTIDEFYPYRGVLTQENVTSLYNNGLGTTI